MSDVLGLPEPGEILTAASQIVSNQVEDDGLADAIRDLLTAFGTAAFMHQPPQMPPLVLLPAIVHAGVTGSAEAALPLCGMTLLLFLGIDLLDDLMDGDATPYWQGQTSAETLLVATTLVSALPQAAIASVDVSAEVRGRLQRALANGLLAMAAGQRADLLSIGHTSATPDEVLASVVGKSGAFTGMLAKLGALLAGAADDVAEAYARWGVAYGTIDQLKTDCADLFREPVGNDLLRGIYTYPLVCLVDSAAPEDREGVVDSIQCAATDRSYGTLVRVSLRQRGILAIVENTIEWYLTAGDDALTRAGAQPSATSALARLSGCEREPTATSRGGVQ